MKGWPVMATETLTPVASAQPAERKYEARMSLIEARATLLIGVRSVKAGGWTERAGKIARQVLSAKFGSYSPSAVADAMRRPDFQRGFETDLEAWCKGWDPAVSDSTQKAREAQYKACLAFIADKGWDRLADAIESVLAHRATGSAVVSQDNAGCKRVHTLVDLTDLFFGIRMTAARAASLRVVGSQH
jgi:hypothetical protein